MCGLQAFAKEPRNVPCLPEFTGASADANPAEIRVVSTDAIRPQIFDGHLANSDSDDELQPVVDETRP